MTLENLVIAKSHLSHGIYLSSRTTDVVIRNCTISDTMINGIHINDATIANVLVENCRMFNISPDWGAVITLMGPKNVVIRNNLIYANKGHIFTITSKGAGKSGNAEDGWSRHVVIVNNTVYQPDDARDGAIFLVNGNLDGFIVKNNIFRSNAPAFSLQDNTFLRENCEFNGNVWAGKSGSQIKNFGKGKDSLFDAQVKFAAEPTMKNFICDLRLKIGSPGADGFPVLKDEAPTDINGKKRAESGPAGAYAETVE